MATAILAIMIIGFTGCGIGMWLNYRRAFWVLKEAGEARAIGNVSASIAQDCRDSLDQIRSVLQEASRIKSARQESPFEQRDKIPSTPSARYVPIARRRAQAEMQSTGPITHDAKVRENNARAMETAG